MQRSVIYERSKVNMKASRRVGRETHALYWLWLLCTAICHYCYHCMYCLLIESAFTKFKTLLLEIIIGISSSWIYRNVTCSLFWLADITTTKHLNWSWIWSEVKVIRWIDNGQAVWFEGSEWKVFEFEYKLLLLTYCVIWTPSFWWKGLGAS